MNTITTSTQQYTAKNTMTNTLLAIAAMLTCLFWASAVQASSYERYERNREEVKVYGAIDSMPNAGLTGKWVVGGRQVEVTDRTRIKEKHGRADIGRYVEVEGFRDGNILVAYEVEVERNREYRSDRNREEVKMYGTVEAMPQGTLNGVWRVNGRDITVDRSTRIKEKYGKIEVGAYVEVEGNYSGNNFIAYKIESERSRRR
ncbi:MAG: hypothetical protein D3913_05125 [Candidatus Electrothrix sp. LOE1_4_5]|jgi:hypothetical protein|nr:hypothetical protein [Candidatus Electrothrix sp. AX1]MCI5117333.1 hypothetical protein [Candidatus Electrothrix gigas]MCI5182866.1 hypothetical protein [Candidatus Electrothrix gigas]MCI5226104.1 hypothetical protein [Candidatus Electrothrix gigas]